MKALKYLPEAEPFIDDILKGLIGRYKLMELTGCSEHKAKTFLMKVKKSPIDNAIARATMD
jgi:hypothetical protein